ncbi:MAG: B12-binding domain-containing radical SAM protein [Clostridiales bacterium GWE2_32_10]|nr:MAG: B12-binding domain-containing radical SAM protein [Clostridiales bacterium GWE2_32_10]HBY20840.1 TIGR03960 family B12-binding radical SAM protein [Clostridiales bacterium]
MDKKVSDYILKQVEKPVRYTGGEYNSVVKNPGDVDIRFAFCFPEVYDIGMSYLGLQILYGMLNERSDTYCERVFAPWVDMETKMRENDIKLFTLETGDEVRKFDFLGFNLLYEMTYTNVLNVLDLSGISIYSKDRGEDEPIVCAGGPCANNPEPLADFIDFFNIGDGEAKLDEVLDLYKEHKKSGGKRREFLEKIARLDGIYVPAFYDVKYNEYGTIKSVDVINENAKPVVGRVVVADLNTSYFPDKPIVPFLETVHNRITLEVFRGCIRGCRFCNAGFMYRPIRTKSVDTLMKQLDAQVKNTGFEEISLVSLSTSDYSGLPELADKIINKYSKQHISLSLPSLRIDEFSLDLMNRLQEVRKSGLTFAPEAGTQRMRDMINKGLTEEEILEGCRLAFEGGWNRVKLYFMMGLPGETDEDIIGIADLARKIVGEYFKVPKEIRANGISINISASCYVPKHNTPFQWESQNIHEEFERKQRLLRDEIKKVKQANYKYHDAKTSVVEGVLSRADRKIGKIIYDVWKKGARFEGWSDHFDYTKWQEAFLENGMSMDFYNTRKREVDEILPWDHINVGVSKKFLVKEKEKALRGEVTPNCKVKCNRCGDWRRDVGGVKSESICEMQRGGGIIL